MSYHALLSCAATAKLSCEPCELSCKERSDAAHSFWILSVECFGIVGMASVNVKDGLVKLLKKESITHGISVNIVNNKLILDFHVIVAYGVCIATVCDNLISNVKYKVENFTGLEIQNVNIFVEGVRVID